MAPPANPAASLPVNPSEGNPDAVSPSRKRPFQELLDSLTPTGRKKRVKDSTLQPYNDAGRWIPRTITPFLNPTTAFHVGLTCDDRGNLQETEDEDEDILRDMPEDVRREYFYAYKTIIGLVTGFKDRMKDFEDEPDKLNLLITEIGSAAGGARSDDTASLKHDGLIYMLKDTNTDTITPPIPRDQSKSGRGFVHPLTARLLCPHSRHPTFELEQGDLLSGTISASAAENANVPVRRR